MTLVSANEEFVEFSLSAQEHQVIRKVLELYPLVPPAHQTVSREMSQTTEYQQLLDHALAEQRQANKEHLQRWLSKAGAFQRIPAGWRFVLKREDAEWLLQVINDVRIGSWLALGSPENTLDPGELEPKQLRLWVAMQVCGMLQMAVLQALGFS